MKLYNTLNRKVENFEPINAGQVKIYTCGPTVYDYQHIGNYSGYIYWDVLVRTLKAYELDVNRVLNITDVGHLVSDEDEGEDKLEKGAKREGKTAREVADFYTTDFLKNFDELKLTKPNTIAKATDYIDQQQTIIATLLEKNFAYKTEQAIYFDVSKLDDYGKLTGQKLTDKEIGARTEVVTDEHKHNPQDFALWFFTVGRFASHEMHWPSPWGDGFPGWHIECSAIVHAVLGEPIDIHTGGVDHIGTHHTNEIAQTEAAFETALAAFWLHNNHMMVDGKKISKSLGNGYTLAELDDKGFSAMDFKIFVLQSHYHSQSNFSFDSLQAAKTRLAGYQALADLRYQAVHFDSPSTFDFDSVKDDLMHAVSDDLNTPKALTIISQLSDSLQIISKAQEPAFTDLIKFIDELLGLDLSKSPDITTDQKQKIADRNQARQSKNYALSDEIRDDLLDQGISLKDTGNSAIWQRI